jgi:hypothetical protein
MITKHFGIGVQANLFTRRFKAPDNFYLRDNEAHGYRRLEILGGIRYYF